MQANTSKSNVLFSNPAQSTRGVLSFIHSFLAAASLPALASSAWGTFHHLGQGPWRERFPHAESYAASQALARLRKKAPSVPFHSLEELSLPPTVRLHVLPGFKNGEVLASVGTRQGSVWYSGDLLANLQRIPGPPASWLFSWTDSGPGFRLFKPAVWLFVKDKRAVRERMNALLAEDPPAIIVPAHGPAVTMPNLVAEARTQIARL